MLQITGSSYERIGELGNISGMGFISGGDVKGILYAYTIGRTINSDGVYLINLQTLEQVSYFPQSFCDPENVVFGKNTAFLHVLGGTQNYTNPLDSRGLFYTLDISNPSSPQLIFTDTINGFPGLAIANARIGINLNDTIYVVTTAGLGHNWVFPDPAYGQIYVYDAREPQVNYITELYAGLWYFDLTISKPKIYIASEWYGIKTIDITDLFAEQDLGNTLTGGWAMKADVYGNTLALANEGYGFKLYDISDVISPELITINDEPGFCQDVKFSADGSYIYAVYQTSEPFRVYDAETMERLGDLTPGGAVTYGWCRMAVFENRVFLDHFEGMQQRLKVIDVSQPSSPQLLAYLTTDVRDMEVDDQGRPFVCNDDSILVYDVSNSGMNLLAGKALPGIQNGLEMAVYKDTVFVFVSFKGLTRYILLNNGGIWSLEEDGNVVLTYGVPQALAADSLGLYIGYTQYGIFTRDKNTLEELSNYRTGLDYKGFTEVWPLTDLFCRNGYIFVTEYFGQTSILTANPLLNLLPPEQEQSSEQEPGIYPNPNNGRFVIEMPDNLTLNEKFVIRIYDLYGCPVTNKEMMILGSVPGSIQVITGLPSGIYLVRFISRKGNIHATKKVIIIPD